MPIPVGVTKDFILKSADNPLWIPAGKVLYDLCRHNPGHNDIPIVAAKLILIGRSHAAQIERGAGGAHLDKIYRRTAENLKKSPLDEMLSRLKPSDGPSSKLALEIHFLVMKCLPEKNNRKVSRRSIASKYLHFHKPKHFVMLDTRARSAAAKFVTGNKRFGRAPKTDQLYFVHAKKCEAIKCEILEKYDVSLTNKQLDEVLLAVADKKRKKRKTSTSTPLRYSRHRR